MRRFLCALAGCFCLLWSLMAQSNKLIQELETRRGVLQKQIAESESLLQTTKKDVGSQLKGLAALTGQIEERKRYILTINRDVDLIDKELASLERQLVRLQKDLEDKKTKYAASVNYLYRNHTVQDKLLFIFSASTLEQTYRRLRYVREYASYQRMQGEEIRKKQRQIQDKRAELTKARKVKEGLLEEREAEKTRLEKQEKEQTFIENFKEFFSSSPEVSKICLVQFFTWIGVMSMFIFFTQFSVHTVYAVPDLTNVPDEIQTYYASTIAIATNFSSICFAIFNLVCFLVSLPIGILSTKFGNKKVHMAALAIMAFSYIMMVFTNNPKLIMLFMALAGIGWASILALPFAMLTEYIKKGSEGSVMGIFNIFIAGPQVLVCTLLAWFISRCVIESPEGMNYHWEYAFLVGAVVLILSVIVTNSIKEKTRN